MKCEIVTKENLSKEAGQNLLLYLTEIVETNYEVVSAKVTETRDCSKEVCSFED